MSLLKDKIALITGAAKGIGASTAHAFASNGAKGIMIVDLDIATAKRTAAEISEKTGCRVIAEKANVSNEEDVKKVFESVKNEFGILDILVNGAGICNLNDLDDISMRSWDLTLDVNLKGTFLFCREALNFMKKNRYGRIINIASQAGKVGGIKVGADYSASKAGIICLTKTIAKKAAEYNITANSVAPGLIATEMTKTFGYDAETIPLKRVGTSEEVADGIVFLASDLSRYITGACLDINGGLTMW